MTVVCTIETDAGRRNRAPSPERSFRRPTDVRSPINGLSLVELCLAFAVMGLALLPVIGLFSTSGKQARQTGDYSLATTTQEKAAEELRLASWENVHLAELIDTDPALTAEAPVTGNAFRFYAPIEDDMAPFGEMLDGVDREIARGFPALARQLESFRLKTSVTKLPLATGGAMDLTLSMSWLDFQRKGQSLDLQVRLPQYRSYQELPPEVEDRARADAAIVPLLYPGRSGTLTGIVGSTGANLQFIRDLGDVVLLSTALDRSNGEIGSLISQARSVLTTAATPREKARAQVALARACEKRAAVNLEVLCYIARPMVSLGAIQLTSSTTTPPPQYGNPPPEPITYVGPLLRIYPLPAVFAVALDDARTAYADAFNAPHGPNLPPRLRTRTFMKLVEMSKLQIVTVGPADTGPLLTLLTSFETYQRGKNPNFADWARIECDKCRDAATIKASYPGGKYSVWSSY
ncbi:MAG: hypothetical protein HY815_07230 [Candidatus Riflebacteria bacterium]|nr:hypothetical protein [Candidatus Riflebacteria bacterium]